MSRKMLLESCRACFASIVIAAVTAGMLTGCPESNPVATSDPASVGLIQVPVNPAPYLLTVDGDPMTMNADLSKGNWEWYRFAAEAGKKYYILASGNAPINIMLFKGVETDAKGDMAIMLWTTDPAEPAFYYWEYPGVHALEEEGVWKTTTNKAIAIPSFVAEETADYYIVVQAARILECLPNCKEEDVRLAAYYDVRTYNIQVSTVAESASANQLTPYNPAEDEAPFLKGQVKINKHDWFYLDAAADSNYMIEFMEPAFSRGNVSALVYSPLGDITCEVIDCDNCNPQPLYTPHEGRYFILVTLDAATNESGHIDLSADQEFFGFDYLLRVFVDDHGNLPALATRVDTPDLNQEVEVAGYLTRGDEDWFDFAATPYSTFWVETRGQFDLRLNVSGNIEEEPLDDAALGLSSFLMRDVDGRNDMAIFQTDRREEVYPFSVKMVHKPLNPFKIDMGAYSIAVIGDDHADAHLANTGRATNVALNGGAQGVLWQTDTDMFVFTAAREHFFYQVQSEGANLLDVRAINGAETALVVQAMDEWPAGSLQSKSLVVYYDNAEPDTRVFAVVAGVDEDDLEAEYSIAVAEDDHRNYTADFGGDIAAATAVSEGANGEGVLWPGDSDVFVVNVSDEQAGRQLEVAVSTNAANNLIATGWWPTNGALTNQNNTFWVTVPTAGEYGVVVTHTGAEPNAIVNYTVAIRFDEGLNLTGNFDNDMAQATAIPIPGNSGSQELWPGDSDVYKVNIEQVNEGRTLSVELTGTGNAPVALLWWSSTGAPQEQEQPKTFTVIPTAAGEYGIVVAGTNTGIVTYSVVTDFVE